MVYHFGVKVLEGKRGLKLTKDKYAIVDNKSSLPLRPSRDIYADEEGRVYNEHWCEKHLKDCLKNFDLNIEFFSLLNHSEFCIEIEKFLKQNSEFIEVNDLDLYDEKEGYYLMVLDEYCQVYIGTTENIKKRIRQHWTKSISFDRLIFGGVDSSKLSIDSFRALDTTRIYVYETNKTFINEDNFINQFSPEFICNRTAGGKFPDGLTQAIKMRKKRNLK
ncbi:hypothetical protein [Lysinibacillus capsici]|uniref:hypothetical protein n=1 Tax=Lysinibacillus capsici TaxID=2115968 RepID=UPI002FDEF579